MTDLTQQKHSVIPDFLPYHKKLADLLEREEDGFWNWFASDKMAAQTFDDHRLSLLKNSVRLDQATYGALYDQAQTVADMLQIEAPLTIYQGQGDARNASLIFMPDTVNIIFHGDLIEFLEPEELTAVLAHEMAHYLHHTREEGRYFIADRMLDWICGEHGAHQAHATSLWLSRLYQEIYADRVGLFTSGNAEASISSLVKVGSGLSKVSVEAYLTQAREALEMTDGHGSEGFTHPETYIRAIALSDWAEDPATADEKLIELVEGKAKLERLDLLRQETFSETTRKLITHILAADWAEESEMLGAHARTFFPDFERKSEAEEAPKDDIAKMDDSLRDYFAFVLADFATVDPDLDDTPLMAAFDISAAWGLEEAFDKIAAKDLKLKAKDVAKIRAERAEAAT